MSYRDDYDALNEQLEAARKEAATERRRMGAKLESEREKVRKLERKLAELKRAKKGEQGPRKKKRPILVMAGTATVLMAGAMAAFTFLAFEPSTPPKAVSVSSPPVRKRPIKRPAPAPPPVPQKKASPTPGSAGHLLSLMDKPRQPWNRALTRLAGAALLAHSGKQDLAWKQLALAEAELKKEMSDSHRLWSTGLLECLNEKISGPALEGAERYVQLKPLLERQLSYRVSADVWTWVGRWCLYLGGGEAGNNALRRGLSAAGKVKSYRRLQTIMAVAAAYVEQRDLAGLDRVAALIEGGGTGLITSDMTKARALLSEIYWKLGRKERSSAFLAKAARRDRSNYFSVEAIALVARAHATAGRTTEAESWLEEATEAVKAAARFAHKRALPHLATTHLLLGRPDKAKDLSGGKAIPIAALIHAGKLKEAAAASVAGTELRNHLALALSRSGEHGLAVKVVLEQRSPQLLALTLATILINTPAEADTSAEPTRP